MRSGHMHGVALNQLLERIHPCRPIGDAKTSPLGDIGGLAREFQDDLRRDRFVVDEGGEDLVGTDQLEFVRPTDPVAVCGRRRVHVDARHEDLHGGVIDRSGVTGTTECAFRLMHAGEAGHGTPDRGIVVGDPIGVVQRRDHRAHDEQADQRIDEDGAALTWIHIRHLNGSATRYRCNA